MACYSHFLTSLTFLFIFVQIQLFVSISEAVVSSENQFTLVNEGDFGEYNVEYNADYRAFFQIFNAPFQLCFYNTTPNAFTLAIRMGLVRSTSRMRWVWEANRGNPVGENATLKLSSNGNLVLAEADGRVAWQTSTANKGVTGLSLLSNGNLVLHDANGKFVWQSFDSPTDTLLLGQSLRVGDGGAANKLVSRASVSVNSNGPYSLELGPKGFSLYYKTTNSPKPILYFSSSDFFTIDKGKLVNLTFTSFPDEDDISYLGFNYHVANPASNSNRYLFRPNYNSTLTYLRLGLDGNIRFFTYNDKVDIAAWEETYTLFSRDSDVTECQLPERCGKFGLCEDNQCVACPSPKGLLGWNRSCEAIKVTSCKPGSYQYYKLEGVDHFMNRYTKGNGPMKESECGSKCSNDCKCVGYFFRTDSSRCWIAYDLNTLTSVGNSTHLAYIKTPNH